MALRFARHIFPPARHATGSLPDILPIRALNIAPSARARAEGSLFVEFPGFSPRPEPSGDVKECSHTVYRLHTKKPLPCASRGPALCVTSSAQGCGRRTYTLRSWLRSFNRCAARDWRPVPRDRRGVGRLPSRSVATSSGASSAAFKTGGRPTTVSPRRIEDLAGLHFQTPAAVE